ncbi:MAG: hypothetical protein NT162_00735 [Candidatus Woesebacteria bacterium]|nr:hypothetical protein [Candidatus Woesebacteria bacterium]
MGNEIQKLPTGEVFFDIVAGFTGIILLGNGAYELAMSFLTPGESQIRAMAVAKILGGISVLVVDYREMKS